MEAQRRERENREFEEGLKDSDEEEDLEEEYDERYNSDPERGFHSRRSSERRVTYKRP